MNIFVDYEIKDQGIKWFIFLIDNIIEQDDPYFEKI